MNRILMLSTGGTLASSHSENGLAPGLHGNDILDRISGLTDGFLVEEEELFTLERLLSGILGEMEETREPVCEQLEEEKKEEDTEV